MNGTTRIFSFLIVQVHLHTPATGGRIVDMRVILVEWKEKSLSIPSWLKPISINIISRISLSFKLMQDRSKLAECGKIPDERLNKADILVVEMLTGALSSIVTVVSYCQSE